MLGLYRERYFDFNVMHFVEKLHSEHEIALSYSWVKKALQEEALLSSGLSPRSFPRPPVAAFLRDCFRKNPAL